MKAPVRVAVTGAAGQIGYALLFRIASGEMLGKDQPVILQLLEMPIDKAQAALKGVMMELEDCAFPLLAGMMRHRRSEGRVQGRRLSRCWSARGRAARAWSARTCCSRTRKIFIEQGKALDAVASRNVKVLVVGNPANTNAYIAMKSAPSLPKKNFTAMLRLDHNRALSQLAAKTGKPVGDDREAGRLGQPLADDVRRLPLRDRRRQVAQGHDQRRGLEPQRLPADGRQARRRDHRGARPVVGRVGRQRRRSTTCATGCWARNGKWVTMGVPSDGSYGIPKDVMYGFPVTTAGGEYKRVEGLPIDDFSREKMNATLKELEEERAGVASLLG